MGDEASLGLADKSRTRSDKKPDRVLEGQVVGNYEDSAV